MRRSPCGCWYLFGWPELVSFAPIVIGLILMMFPGKYTAELTLANGPCASCEDEYLDKLRKHPQVIEVELSRVCDCHQILRIQTKSRFSAKEFEKTLQLACRHGNAIRIERYAKLDDKRTTGR